VLGFVLCALMFVATVGITYAAFRGSSRSPVQSMADESPFPRLLPPALDDEFADPARQLHDRIGDGEVAQALARLSGADADQWIARGLNA
jgi:hypothetical protein